MILSLLAALSCLVSSSHAAAARAAYPSIKAPVHWAGKAFSTTIKPGAQASVVSISIPKRVRDSFSDANPRIELQFNGQPPAEFREGSRKLVMIRGNESLALLPADPKPGDKATIIPISPVHGRWPARTERLTKATLEKLDRSLAALGRDPSRYNFSRAQAVLDRHFSGSRSELGRDLETIPEDRLVVASVEAPSKFGWKPPVVGAATLGVADYRRTGHLQEIGLVLSSRGAGAARRSSVVVNTAGYAPALYKNGGGWVTHSHLLRRSETERRPALRAAAARIWRALRRAREGRPSLNGETPRARLLDRIESELDALRRGRKSPGL